MTAFSKAILADLIIGRLTADVVQVSDPDDAANRVFIDSNLWGTDKPSILFEYRDLAGGQQAIAGAFIIAGEDATFGNFVFLRSPQELTQGYMALRLTPTKAYFLGSNVGRVYAVEIGSALIPVDVSILGTGALAMGSGDLAMASGDLVQTSGGINSPAMRPAEMANATNFPITSATYVGDNNSGLAFIAPASGAVRVDWAPHLGIAVTANVLRVVHCSLEIRTGSTIGSGSVVSGQAFDDARSVRIGIGLTSGMNTSIEASNFAIITGLTPGGSYHVRLGYRVSTVASATASSARRRITVAPCM